MLNSNPTFQFTTLSLIFRCVQNNKSNISADSLAHCLACCIHVRICMFCAKLIFAQRKHCTQLFYKESIGHIYCFKLPLSNTNAQCLLCAKRSATFAYMYLLQSSRRVTVQAGWMVCTLAHWNVLTTVQ